MLKQQISALFIVMISLLALPSEASSVGILAKNTTAKPAENLKKDSFGRDTPRSTMKGFIQALTDKDADLVAHYLDDKGLKNKNSTKIVTNLKNALDRGGLIEPLLDMSDDPQGNLADRLPSNQEQVGEITLEDKTIALMLIRKTGRDQISYWQISEQTLSQIPDTKPMQTLASQLPLKTFKGKTIFGHEVADILVMLILVVVWLFMVWLPLFCLHSAWAFLYPKIRKKPFNVPAKLVLPLSFVIVATVLPQLMVEVGLPVTLRSSVTRAKDVLAWSAMAWLGLRLIDAVFRRAEALSVRRSRPEQVSILSLLRKVAKAVMLILALIVILGNLGFDLTAGIAALGVGGLALAFGAQKTIENLIGSVVVVADRPVHVGDYCRFGHIEGTIIDIGIRSSRIRTLNRTIVTVPNGEFSAMQIENYTARDMFHFLHEIYIKRSVSPDTLEKCISDLKLFLLQHPAVNDEWTQVRISQLRQDCVVVELRCYLFASHVREFYDKQTALILEVLKQLEADGIEQALPSQTITLQNDIAPIQN